LYATVLFGASVPLSFLGIYQNSLLPLKDYQYALLIVLLFVIVAHYWYGINKNFISVNTDGDNIVIKYFRILPKIIKPKPKMVRIPKSSYVKYKIESSLFGKKKALYLFQRTKKGIVKYPPIYVNSLKKEEMEQLKQALKFQ
jgi:hypothetical protein